MVERKLGVRPRVRIGGIGVLDVFVNGRRVFSKKAEPAVELETIVSRIEAARG